MGQQGWAFLKLLCNAYFPGRDEDLARLLPPEEAEALKAIPYTAKDPKLLLFTGETWQARQHYSWLDHATTAMGPLGVIAAKAATYPPVIREWLLHLVAAACEHTEASPPPRQLVATPELQALLELTKPQLVELIDYLAMFDVAEELRAIVDKNVLQAVTVLIPPPQQRLLRQCLAQKNKLPLPSLNLTTLYKQPKRFAHTLHKRGLERLAMALSGQPADCTWHIIHTLDRGRGAVLTGQIQSEDSSNALMARMQLTQILPLVQRT